MNFYFRKILRTVENRRALSDSFFMKVELKRDSFYVFRSMLSSLKKTLFLSCKDENDKNVYCKKKKIDLLSKQF